MRLSLRSRQTGFARFDPRNGFLSVSLVPNPNTSFAEQVSEQLHILFACPKKELVVGCWITNIRDVVVTSKGNFFQEGDGTVGELFALIVDHKKAKEIFGEGDKCLMILNHTEIRKLKIVIV